MILVAVVAAACGFLLGRAWGRAYPCAHEWTLQLSRDRVWLECPLCGRESPGWNLSITPPPPTPPQPRPQPQGAVWPPMILH